MEIKVKKKLLWAVLLSLVFMFVLLMRVEWEHFSLISSRMDTMNLLVACSIFTFSNFIRAVRFHKLDHLEKKLIHWWNVNGLYNLLTATLPGGAGEAAAVYVLKKYSNFSVMAALRILLLARVMDLFALSSFFFIATIFIERLISFRETAILLSGGLFLLSTCALFPASEKFALNVIQWIPIQGNLIQRVKSRISELMTITEKQRDNNSIGITMCYSLVMMGIGVVSVHLVFNSFGVDFTLIQSAYCYGIYTIFQIIPMQGIAGIGTQAAWWALALNAAGYGGPDAIALGIVLHGTFYIFISVTALSAFATWHKGRTGG